MRSSRIGALAWALCWQYFVGEALAIQGWRTPYSLSDNFISDLGALSCAQICSPWHAVMNASFLLQSVLLLAGAVLTGPLLPANYAASAARWLIALAALGVAIVGVFPEDAGSGPHYFGAAMNLACSNLGMAALGLALIGDGVRPRVFGAAALAGAAFGLFGLICLGAHAKLGLGVGTVERIAAYPFPIWIGCFGVWLFRRQGIRSSRGPGSP